MCLFKPKCHHKWIVIYRGRLQMYRQCQYCGKQGWIKI